MVRAARPDQVLFVHRRRPRHAAAATFNIVIMREELVQQFGGGEPEDQDPGIRHGHRRRGYNRLLRLLLDLIQIMYQKRDDSPFQTHPATTAISITAICISGFATTALFNSKAVKVEEEDKGEQQSTGKYFLYCRRILDILVLISGVVTLSRLVSVFVPDGLGWIVFVSCASTIPALLIGWHFLFLPIFERSKSGHGELEPSRV